MSMDEMNHRIRVITASVRTTNRINALLNESIQEKRNKKFNSKLRQDSTTESVEIHVPKPKLDFDFFKNNFTMDHIFKLIETIIADRLQWDRFNRIYDPWKSAQLAESLATEIRDRAKLFKHQRYKIVCIVSVIEKQHQGVHNKMVFLMDKKVDNFTSFVHERATFNIVATVFLIHKEKATE